ncbi:MAG: histidine--tRNA ligase [Bradymonadales bacterium]|nr:histidine--tRNA ligase [Bradymonadales bacterium]
MVSIKPPAGMRDFLPLDLSRREYALSIIRNVYLSHHFEPIETPVLERIETLQGKYGEEGDQLIYQVLKRGQKLEEALSQAPILPHQLADLGLRYDLTVPLCRVVAQYQHELPSIFKCFQIRPVWRADRPARGRFREFVQCDVDVIGTRSILAEVDVVSAACEALAALGLADFQVRINDRRLLTAITLAAGIPPQKSGTTLVALDKLDKIGPDGVERELGERGIGPASIKLILSLLADGCATGDEARLRLGQMAQDLAERLEPQIATDLQEILHLLAATGIPSTSLLFDPTLARGLSYYTGPIYEISLQGSAGSVGGGGRYDELVGMFLGRTVPACGVSLGIERVLMIMEERGLLAGVTPTCDVFVACFPEVSAEPSLRLAAELRARGVVVDCYPEPTRLKKQLAFAQKMGARVVLLAGPDEMRQGQVTARQMSTGRQITLDSSEAADHIVKLLAGQE